MKGFTYYKGVKNYQELIAYMDQRGEMPECESFKYLSPGDDKLIGKSGYIAEENFDDSLFRQIPKTLREAL